MAAAMINQLFNGYAGAVRADGHVHRQTDGRGYAHGRIFEDGRRGRSPPGLMARCLYATLLAKDTALDVAASTHAATSSLPRLGERPRRGRAA